MARANHPLGVFFLPIIFWSFLLIFLSGTGSAQEYPFKSYSTADGLPQATVSRIFQDSRGFLWIGTHGGVSRYNGLEFRNYLTRGDDRSVINDIWESPEGTIWFATHGNGIAILDQQEDSLSWLKANEGSIPDDFVEDIFGDREGNIWIGTNGGLYILEAGGGTKSFDVTSGLPNDRVKTIIEDRNGEVLLGTSGGLVSARLRDNGALETTEVLPQAIRSLLVKKNGDILVGTRWDGAFLKSRDGTSHILSKGKVESLCEDSRGRTWAGTTSGIYFWENKQPVHIGAENGLESVLIGEIFEDREGMIWIGTGDGLLKMGPVPFVNYRSLGNLESSIVTSFCIDRSGAAWVGTFSGLARLSQDGMLRTYGSADGLFDATISALTEDVNGDLWIGTFHGLNLIRAGRLITPRIDGIDAGEPIRSILATEDGTVWFGSRGKIIEFKNGETETRRLNVEGSDDLVTALLVDRDGKLWFGTNSHGVGRFDAGQGLLFGDGAGLPNLWIESLLQDQSGTIWVGTHRGVVRFEGGRFVSPIHSVASLESGVVYSITEDSLGMIWFGTDEGVFGWKDSIQYHIDAHDGLLADRVHRIWLGQLGEVWFGTHDGLSKADMRNVYRSFPSFPLYFRSVTAGPNNIRVDDGGEVRYEDRTLMFRFNALSFIDERNVRFQWHLDGADQTWQPAELQRQVRYTNLNPGDYVLSVRAANRAGPWSVPATFAFAVMPPFWLTWWFISAVTVVLVGGLTALYRYRVNQLLRIERMRTRIATDLHDDIGASLSRISLFSEVAKEEAENVSPRLYEMAQRIGDNARELLDAVGTLVWSVDPRHDRFQDVVTHMKDFSQEMLAAKGIDYVMELDKQVEKLNLSLESRKNLLLIFKEAVNNVVRHSHCSFVRINLKLMGTRLVLEIEDNGRGIPPSGYGEGHGVSNMRMRAESIGGQCTVGSAGEEGTRVTVHLPLREV